MTLFSSLLDTFLDTREVLQKARADYTGEPYYLGDATFREQAAHEEARNKLDDAFDQLSN